MKNTHNRVTILSIVFLLFSTSFISGLNAQSSPPQAVPMPKAELNELSIAMNHIRNECSENIQCPTVDPSNAKKLAEAMEQVVITLELFKGWITEGMRTTTWVDPQGEKRTSWNNPEWVNAKKLVDDAHKTMTETQEIFYRALSKYNIPRSYQGEKGGNWRDPYAAIRNLSDRLVKQIQTLKPLQLAFMLRPAPFPTMKLSGKTFKPGETITVEFTARQCYGNTAWIGIIPSAIQHKNERLSNRNKIARKFMERKTSGSFTFTAPQKTGSYDFRMFDSETNGNEVLSVNFNVKKSDPTEKPKPSTGLYKEKWLVTYQYTVGNKDGGIYYALLKENGKWDFTRKNENNIQYVDYGTWKKTGGMLTLNWNEVYCCSGTYEGYINGNSITGTMTSSQGWKGTWTAKKIE